jgi:hypothetical protein
MSKRLIADLPSTADEAQLGPLKIALAMLGLRVVERGEVLHAIPIKPDAGTGRTQRLREQDITPRPRTWPPTKEPTP